MIYCLVLSAYCFMGLSVAFWARTLYQLLMSSHSEYWVSQWVLRLLRRLIDWETILTRRMVQTLPNIQAGIAEPLRPASHTIVLTIWFHLAACKDLWGNGPLRIVLWVWFVSKCVIVRGKWNGLIIINSCIQQRFAECLLCTRHRFMLW